MWRNVSSSKFMDYVEIALRSSAWPSALGAVARTSQRPSAPEQGWGQGWPCSLCLVPGQDSPRDLEGFLPPRPQRGRQGMAGQLQPEQGGGNPFITDKMVRLALE